MTNQAVTPAPTTSRTLTKPKATSPPATIKGLLEGEAFRSAVSKALPKHLPPDRFIRVALTALMRTPKLADCDQASFFQALLALSQMGLEPDGRRAHLIPFENRKRGVVECQLIVDYKGLVDLAMRSGSVSYIHANVVCENDEFEYDRGQLVHHRINFREERGRVYAVYAICRFKDTGEKCEVMGREDVEAVRARSKAANSGPWVTDWNEMGKKTVFRRLSKWLPLSAEFRDALEVDAEGLEERRLEIARPVFDSQNFLPAPKFEQAPAPPVIAAMPEPEPEPDDYGGGALDPLAPRQEPVPPPPAEGPELSAEHHELARLLDENGITFARLAAWGVKKGWEPGWDSLTSIAELPQRSVQRLLRTKVGLIRELKLA